MHFKNLFSWCLTFLFALAVFLGFCTPAHAQTGCTYIINVPSAYYNSGGHGAAVAASVIVPPEGSNLQINMTTQSHCPWNPAVYDEWIQQIPNGSGSTTLNPLVLPNTTGESRNAWFVIGGQYITVGQDSYSCSYDVSASGAMYNAAGNNVVPPYTPASTSVALGSGKANLAIFMTTSSGCPWSVTSFPPWIPNLSSWTNKSGNTTISVAVEKNETTSSRTGEILIGGKSIIVTQDADCNRCYGSVGAATCQFLVCSKSSAPLLSTSYGIRMNSGIENVLFTEYDDQGMGRFVSNKGGNDIFIPQKTPGEFASFLGHPPTGLRVEYAVKEQEANFSSAANSYSRCPSSYFSADNGGTVTVPGSGDVTVPGTEGKILIGSHIKQPIGVAPISVIVGSTDVGGPIQFRYERNHDGEADLDCIYDNQGNKSCAKVVFQQDNKVRFVAGEESTARTYKNYIWKPGTVEASALYVSVNNAGNTAVSDCDEDYNASAPPINGECGTAQTDGLALTAMPAAVPPSKKLCDKGNISVAGVTALANSSGWTWTCDGVGSGATPATCTAGAGGCPASTTVSWPDSRSGPCTGSTSSVTSSGSTTGSITATGTYDGSATFKCNAGTLVVEAAPTPTCAQRMNSCKVSVSYGNSWSATATASTQVSYYMLGAGGGGGSTTAEGEAGGASTLYAGGNLVDYASGGNGGAINAQGSGGAVSSGSFWVNSGGTIALYAGSGGNPGASSNNLGSMGGCAGGGVGGVYPLRGADGCVDLAYQAPSCF